MFTKENPLKVFESFAGYGSQSLALKYLGIPHKVVGISEIDPKPISVYYSIENREDVVNYGDITKIRPQDLPDMDLFTYSFPCFTKDVLVLTKEGYKHINKVSVRDEVLTHDGSFQKVLRSMKTGVKDTMLINAMSFDEIKCTPNHRFYVRKKEGSCFFTEPTWKEAELLTKEDYLGYAIDTTEVDFKWDGVTCEYKDGRKARVKDLLKSKVALGDFWWLMGRYVGDGWQKKCGVIISVKPSQLSDITDVADRLGFHYTIVYERTALKVHFNSKELNAFVSIFGKGAMNKVIPYSVISLPNNLLKSFIEGYESADGSYAKGIHRITSVSRELIYGIAQCIAKVYRRPFSIYKSDRGDTCVIEGRQVRQHTFYTVSWKIESSPKDQAFYADDFIWFPFRGKELTGEKESVYDLTVDKNHSFTANGAIVHNCTDISQAGHQKGLERGSGTRSSLLYECEKIIEGKMPKFLLMENVSALVSKKFRKYYDDWVKYLDSLGYETYTEVLQAYKVGGATRRERIYAISFLKSDPIAAELSKKYLAPIIKPRTLDLDKVLEKDPDEKLFETYRFKKCYNQKNILSTEWTTKGCFALRRWDYKEDAKVEGRSSEKYTRWLAPLTDNMIPTLTTSNDCVYFCKLLKNGDYGIRYLTPREMFRIMGMHDEDIDAIVVKGINSTTAAFTCGNSIVIDVLMAIFASMFKDNYEVTKC